MKFPTLTIKGLKKNQITIPTNEERDEITHSAVPASRLPAHLESQKERERHALQCDCVFIHDGMIYATGTRQ